MNKDLFLDIYPKRKDDSNKYQNGVVGIFAGSKGMAGACNFNIIGARCLGASYINVYLPKEIYPIATTLQPACVYHFLEYGEFSSLNKCQAICFGSGMTNCENRGEILRYLINSRIDLVIDAEGLRVLASDLSMLDNHSQTIVLTPHLGEFSTLIKKPISEILLHKEQYAKDFAIKHNVYLVLKGKNTLIVSPEGKIEINNTGNAVLATAGSGDILTGMITALLALQKDSFGAIIAGVWYHGYLADLYIENHSKLILDYNELLRISDQFLFENGY